MRIVVRFVLGFAHSEAVAAPEAVPSRALDDWPELAALLRAVAGSRPTASST
jgi:hypothetical protein